MPSATISNLGFTAQFAPQIKRATATLSDGSVVAMVPDTNIAAMAGDDATGTPKIRFYKSDTTRTTWTLNFTYTPSPQAMSSTKAFVGSMVLDTSNNIHLVYQGTDNSLNYVPFTSGSGTWSAGTLQSVVAANAVTNRYRSMDIDVTSTNRPAIIVYESKASAGPSAWTRVYIRNDNGTTWRKAHEYDHATGAGGSIPIYTGSEDVSISWNAAGISSNVGQLLIYYTRIGFFYDHGDIIAELSYNVNTGTDNSATVLGTWPKFNQDQGGGRRGWIFKTNNDKWQVALVVGQVRPSFQTARLTHGAYSAPYVNKTTTNIWNAEDLNGVRYTITPRIPQIDYSINAYNAIGCVYADNRVMFGFLTSRTYTVDSTTSWSLSSVVFRYDDAVTTQASYVDNQTRPLDNYFTYGQQPIGVYGGGNNRNQAGDLKFNFMGLYGYSGNSQLSSARNIMRAVIDTFYDPPTNVGPTLSVGNDTPVLQVRVQNTALYPNIKGKIEWTLARDSGFTTDVRQILQPDSEYQNYGSSNALVPPAFNISIQLSGVGAQKLYSGTWYMRARVVSDLGQASSWSSTTSFVVAHAPSALAKIPSAGSLVPYGYSGSIAFSWNMSDTEPTDAQTAYRLVILRLDTGATVLDTGKVLSSVQSSVQTISSGLQDVTLQWSVSLWDTDDVQGPFSNPIQFTTSAAPVVRVTSPTDGATITAAAPVVAWSVTFSGSRTQRAYKVSAIIANALDVFTRTVGSGSWGSTSDGKAWTTVATADGSYSVNGTQGVHTRSAIGASLVSLLPSTYLNSDQEVSGTTAALTTGSGVQRFGLIARYVNSSNYFSADVQFNADNSMGVRIVKVVGGVETLLGAVNPISGFTYVAGVRYNLRFKVSGENLYAKVWPTTGSQPAYWHVSVTSSVLSAAGYVGPFSRWDAGVTTALPSTTNFDNYSMYDSDNPVVLATSNWIQDTAGTYAFPTNILANNGYYLLSVDVQDSNGMQGQDSIGVLTSWTPPVDATFGVSTDAFGATVTWTNAGVDVDFVAWRVYRRYMVTELADLDDDDTANTWVLIYENTDAASSYSYKDYLIPCNTAVDYTVVQVVDRFGSIIESPISSFTTVTSPSDRYYFIPTVPIGTIAAYEASNVIDDNYTDEVENETLHILDRGRQVQVGDDLGATGTLQIQLRNPVSARGDRQFLQRLASTKNLGVWMKTPFGDVRCVKFLPIQVRYLAGTGTTELSDLTIPYVEIITDPSITRS